MYQYEMLVPPEVYNRYSARLKIVSCLLHLNRSAIRTACKAIRGHRADGYKHVLKNGNEDIIQLQNSLRKFLQYRSKYRQETQHLRNKLQGLE